MTIQVPEWKILIILTGVAFLCLGQIFSFIAVQQERLRQRLGLGQLAQYDYICPNGTKKCSLGYQLFTLDRNNAEHKTSISSKTKVSKKLTKRKKAHSLKSAKRDRHVSLEGRKSTTKNAIKIPNEEFIAWQLHADMQVYMFDMEEHEDPNMSGLGKASFNGDDVRIDDADERRRASPKLPRYSRSPHPSSDPAEVSDLTDDWTREQLFYNVFYLIVGVFLGCILRPHLSTLKCSICNYFFFMISTRKPKRYKERPKIEVDSNLNLAMLPFDLEDFLIKKLDVRHRDRRFYGWQKVGEAFNINKDDLRYLKIEYKRDNGSPTGTLLEMLGKAENKTISDLVEVLKSPKVNRLDITSMIKLT